MSEPKKLTKKRFIEAIKKREVDFLLQYFYSIYFTNYDTRAQTGSGKMLEKSFRDEFINEGVYSGSWRFGFYCKNPDDSKKVDISILLDWEFEEDDRG